MDRAVFDLTFGGPGLEDHSISISELAPSLVSLSELFQESADTLKQEGVRTDLRLRARRPGSFNVDLEVVVAGVWATAAALVANAHYLTAQNLLQLLFGKRFSLSELIRFLRGRTPEKVVTQADGKTIEIHAGGDVLFVNGDVHRLYQNPKVLDASRRMVAVLDRPSIDSIRINAAGEELQTFTQADLPLFDIAPPDVEANVSRRDTKVVVRAPAFDRELQWKLTEGGSAFSAPLEDQEFMALVLDGRLRFGAKTILTVTLRQEQTMERGELRVKFAVEKVIQVYNQENLDWERQAERLS
jgi:hypothetical protein